MSESNKKNGYVSQKAYVRAHLLKGKSITQMDALRLYGSLRLSAIIYDLRDEGIPIITKMIQVDTNKRVGSYHVEESYLKNQNSK